MVRTASLNIERNRSAEGCTCMLQCFNLLYLHNYHISVHFFLFTTSSILFPLPSYAWCGFSHRPLMFIKITVLVNTVEVTKMNWNWRKLTAFWMVMQREAETANEKQRVQRILRLVIHTSKWIKTCKTKFWLNNIVSKFIRQPILIWTMWNFVQFNSMN